jgi:hypothetical protein
MRLAAAALLTTLLITIAASSASAQDGVELRAGFRQTGRFSDYTTYAVVGADAEVHRGAFAGVDLSVHRYDPGTGRLERTGMFMFQGGYRYPSRIAGVLQPYARVGAGRTVWRYGTGLVMGGAGVTAWLSDSVAAHVDFQRLKVLAPDVLVPLNVFTVGITYAPRFLRWRNR